MEFFALHRMATPYNVMDALPQFTTHPSVMRHLNWLANKGWLRRHRLKNKGYVYNITRAGYEKCLDKDINVPASVIPYKYKGPSGKRKEHEILITTYDAKTKKCVRSTPHVSILSQTRFALDKITVCDPETGEELFPFEFLKPDFCQLILHQKKGLLFCMMEAIRGVESIDDLRRMVEQYEEWEHSRAGQLYLVDLYTRFGAKQPTTEFQVHCVIEADDWRYSEQWKERRLMLQTFHVGESTQAKFLTTTVGELEKALSSGLSINHPIWHRTYDLIAYRPQWNYAPDGTRTRLVDGIANSLKCYPLFA